jgi:hypothetical protein
MRGSKHDVPMAFEDMGFCSRQAEWGDMNVALETAPAGLDTTPVFRGLPDDRCQCPHWGVVLAGTITFRYADKTETYVAGDAYYAPPGHTPVVTHGTEVIEFSPTEELGRTMEILGANLAAAAVAPA